MIKYYSKESALALKSAAPSGLDLNGINIGAPVPYYAFTEERHAPIFQLRMRSVSLFLDAIRGSRSSMTLLEIGCGNGANGRYVAKNFIQHKGQFGQTSDGAPRQMHVIFADVSDTMLEECERRSIELQHKLPGFTFEVVQVDLHKTDETSQFAAAFEGRVDCSMSIQFFYNTNLQLNRQRAQVFGKITRDGGGMIVQCYRRTGLRSILGGYRRLLMRRATWDSVELDHYIARRLLAREGFALAGRLEQKFDPALVHCDHFDAHLVDLFFKKR